MITWIVIIFAALAIMLWWLKGPFYHKGMKRENVERFVKGLVTQCDDGSLLIVEHKNTGRFIQIAKYHSSSKFPILHFGFPKAEWSSKYFERLKASLQNERIKYQIQETGEIDVERVRKTLNLYWTEVKKLFPDAWGKPPSESRLMHGVGIRSMGALMDRIMCNINPDEKTAQEKVQKALLPIKSHCAWTEGCWDQLNSVPWNYLQNTHRDKNLLTNMLVRVYLGVNS